MTDTPEKTPKPSPMEALKESSRYLRGTIAEELRDDTDHFNKDNGQLLKFHGTYQQDDRDLRQKSRAEGKKGKVYSLMVRTRIPAGKMTYQQFLAHLDLGDELADSTIRLTSRQAIQLHHVPKNDIKEVIRRINEAGLTTRGACGDVNRNVMCCPAPYKDGVREQLQQLATDLADRFAIRTPGYKEIWLIDDETGEKELAASDAEVVEPLYGKFYMPRKFKIGIALPEDNCIDIYTNDLGLLAIHRDGAIVGYNVLAGGGMGVTPAIKKTYPALGKRIGFVTADKVLEAAEAVLKAQRDFGNRSDRKQARLKYLVDKMGVKQFRAKVEEYLGEPLADCDPADVTEVDDHIGWDEQGDGKWFYGLNIENGRIHDSETTQLKTALREICTTLEPGIRLTAHQSLLICDVAADDKQQVEEILRKHNVPLSEDVSTVRRWSMACVAWPTCGLSITESERALPGIIDAMEAELSRQGLAAEKFNVRMTGCPNGCARPYNSDIGLVGKAKDRYTLFLGGTRLGTRLNFIYKDLVPRDQVVAELAPLFAYFSQDRNDGESFGDFCNRKGKDNLLEHGLQAEE
jgi:sulfite reductase (ferredoxin)